MHLPLPHYLVILTLLTAHAYGIACYAGQQSSDLEQSICGLKEPFVFWLWSSAAGEPSAARLAQFANIEDVAITSSDGRILRGYKLKPPPYPGRQGFTQGRPAGGPRKCHAGGPDHHAF